MYVSNNFIIVHSLLNSNVIVQFSHYQILTSDHSFYRHTYIYDLIHFTQSHNVIFESIPSSSQSVFVCSFSQSLSQTVIHSCIPHIFKLFIHIHIACMIISTPASGPATVFSCLDHSSSKICWIMSNTAFTFTFTFVSSPP